MPLQFQFRRGSTSQNNSFTGALGEISIDTSLYQIRLHDGTTPGGYTIGGSTTATTSTFLINNTTVSSNTSTGALRVLGGVGVGGALYVSTSSYIAGAQIITTATINNFVTPTTPGGTNTQVQYNSSSAFAGSANLTFNGTGLTTGNINVTSATAPTNGVYLKSSATSGLTFQNASHTSMQTYYGLAGLASTGADTVGNNSTQFYGFGNDAGPAITGGGTYKTANIYNFSSGYSFLMTDVPAIIYIDGGARGSNYSYTCPEANGALVIDITGMGGNAASGRNGIFVQNGASYFQTPSVGVKAFSNSYASNNDSIWGYVRPTDPNGGGSPNALRSTVDTSTGSADNCTPRNLYLENATVDNYTKTNGGGAMAIWNDRRSGSTSRTAIQFFRNSIGNGVGSITTTDSSTSFNTSSDARLKNITGSLTADSAISFIMSLQPRVGTWKKSNLPFVGFVAEEYQTVDSGAVHGEANATQIIGNVVDDKGTIIHEGVVESSTILEGCTWVQTEVKPIYQTLEYGSAAWCANMTAFVQNLQTTISEMQTAILALQSK